MRLLVLGLDAATPEIVFADPGLVNLRRLMHKGCWGRLESVVPPITVPAWMCMATSRDPGSLGVYGFRNRRDHSYDGLSMVDSSAIRHPTVWDVLGQLGKRATVVGVPPNFPVRRTTGASVGCFLTPNTSTCRFALPESLECEIAQLVGQYPVDVAGFRTQDRRALRTSLFDMSRRQFTVLRHLVRDTDWDYLQFVEIGLDRAQHGFWKHHDPEHRQHETGHEHSAVVMDYYRHLDAEIGELLALLDEDTAVLVLSDHGAQRLDGGFCINEWLYREGFLALHGYPREVTPLAKWDVDWPRTAAWSEGGYYARVFLNVRGREPAGAIDPADYQLVRRELKQRLEATVDDLGQALGTRVFFPEEVYREVRGVAPDLIVYLGDLYWRSVGSIGHGRIHVQENDTGPDDCNHAQFGAFVLAGPGVPAAGALTGAHLLDMSPTLLDLAGVDVPRSMQGGSILPAAQRAYRDLSGTPRHGRGGSLGVLCNLSQKQKRARVQS